MYQPQNKPAPRSAEHNALKVNPIQFSNLPGSFAWELYLKMNPWTRLITKQDALCKKESLSNKSRFLVSSNSNVYIFDLLSRYYLFESYKFQITENLYDC